MWVLDQTERPMAYSMYSIVLKVTLVMMRKIMDRVGLSISTAN